MNRASRGTRARVARSAPPGPADLPRLRRALQGWYREHRRALPWRDTGDEYRVLVSEFMLQQTQVATVLPHFDRFLVRFPTVDVLAGASDDAVRAAWSGLGYYRRARSLHATARTLVDEHRGRLPSDPEALRRLPGVGAYTAAALASIVHDEPAAVVDGNVIRVVARLRGIRGDVTRPAVRRAIDAEAQALLDPRAAGDWNQAMMELGALVCTPRSPRCPDCPWEAQCAVRASGDPEALPVKPAAPAARKLVRAVGVFRRGGRVLLVRRRDPSLLDGTWELPGVDLDPAAPAAEALADHLAHALGRAVRVGRELGRVPHAITNRRFTVIAFAADTRVSPRAAKGRRVWVVPGDVGAMATSSMTTKLLRRVMAVGW